MASTFTATVKNWSDKAKRNVDLIRREAAQEIANRVTTPIAKGGNMPVISGFLRGSLQASLTAMPQTTETPEPDVEYAFHIGDIISVIATADLDDTIFLGFTANYGPKMEERYGFVRIAAMEWPQIVAEVAAKYR